MLERTYLKRLISVIMVLALLICSNIPVASREKSIEKDLDAVGWDKGEYYVRFDKNGGLGTQMTQQTFEWNVEGRLKDYFRTIKLSLANCTESSKNFSLRTQLNTSFPISAIHTCHNILLQQSTRKSIYSTEMKPYGLYGLYEQGVTGEAIVRQTFFSE